MPSRYIVSMNQISYETLVLSGRLRSSFIYVYLYLWHATFTNVPVNGLPGLWKQISLPSNFCKSLAWTLGAHVDLNHSRHFRDVECGISSSTFKIRLFMFTEPCLCTTNQKYFQVPQEARVTSYINDYYSKRTVKTEPWYCIIWDEGHIEYRLFFWMYPKIIHMYNRDLSCRLSIEKADPIFTNTYYIWTMFYDLGSLSNGSR